MKLVIALLFAFILNLLLWFGQIGLDAAATDAGVALQTKYVYNGSIIDQYDTGDYTLNPNSTELLPEGQASVIDSTSDSFFVDTFASIKSWFESTTIGKGVSYLNSFLFAFPNALKSTTMPVELIFGISALWYSIIVFLIVMMFRGYGS